MTGVSTLGQALRQIENIKSQQLLFSQLSTQMATGKKSQTYTGISTDALASMRSRTDFSSLDVYNNNIVKANTRIGLMLTSIEEFQAQSNEFSQSQTTMVQQGAHQEGDDVVYDDPMTSAVESTIVGKTSGTPDNDLQAVIDHANNLYAYMTDLLNTKEGDRYVLAGADSSQKPLADTGTLDAAISTMLTDWKAGTITTDQLIANLRGRTATTSEPDVLTDTVIGYSASLSSGNAGDVFIRATEDSELKYTALANEQGFRDIMVALSVLKNENLPPVVDVYPDGVYPGIPTENGAPGDTTEEQQDNFYTLFRELSTMVNQGIDMIDKTRYRLETVRVQMGQAQDTNQTQKTLLLNTITAVEDVDTNEVAVKLTTLQTQLEASYQVTALSASLTLSNFL